MVNNVIQTIKLGKWMLSIGFSDADCDIPISFNDQTLLISKVYSQLISNCEMHLEHKGAVCQRELE